MEASLGAGWAGRRAYLVSSECVRMCRQLTIIAESLPGEREESGTRGLCEEGRRGAKGRTDAGSVNLTKERNPVSDKSCQLTEQTGRESR